MDKKRKVEFNEDEYKRQKLEIENLRKELEKSKEVITNLESEKSKIQLDFNMLKGKNKGDYDFLFEYANNGDIESQYEVGRLYYEGIHKQKNITKAVEWFTKAGDSGHINAQNFIGWIYDTGVDEIKQNKNIAKIWYLKSAQQNNATGIHNLAILYLQNSEGTKEN